MYTPIEYPKWKYHAKKPAVIVNDPAEEKKLGYGWQDSPIVEKPTSKDAPQPEDEEFDA